MGKWKWDIYLFVNLLKRENCWIQWNKTTYHAQTKINKIIIIIIIDLNRVTAVIYIHIYGQRTSAGTLEIDLMHILFSHVSVSTETKMKTIIRTRSFAPSLRKNYTLYHIVFKKFVYHHCTNFNMWMLRKRVEKYWRYQSS